MSSTFGADPARYDPAHAARIARAVGGLFGPGGWFELQVEGWDNLPPAPALLVSNHSGGTTIPDAWGLLFAWQSRFAGTRVVHALAHDLVFALPAVGAWFERLGVLRARPGMGEEVLTRWRRDLFVFPGGDQDTWRPYRERYRVHFAGRTGYARLALQTGIPVNPVANGGAHESLVVLTDGRGLARRLGLQRRFRAEVFPVHLSLPWGLGVGPWPHVPWPVRMSYRIGPAVPFPPSFSVGRAPTEAEVAAYDEAVRAALQRELDQLAAEAESLPVRVRRMARVVRATKARRAARALREARAS